MIIDGDLVTVIPNMASSSASVVLGRPEPIAAPLFTARAPLRVDGHLVGVARLVRPMRGRVDLRVAVHPDPALRPVVALTHILCGHVVRDDEDLVVGACSSSLGLQLGKRRVLVEGASQEVVVWLLLLGGELHARWENWRGRSGK